MAEDKPDSSRSIMVKAETSEGLAVEYECYGEGIPAKNYSGSNTIRILSDLSEKLAVNESVTVEHVFGDCPEKAPSNRAQRMQSNAMTLPLLHDPTHQAQLTNRGDAVADI
ncbi:hypothetical protein Anapl_02121 [Anas platyrhynchos]|uniref:Uncharacterized protein n=1 Tax=Anas platyrhynchos TaxID=8839 RepID=R0LTW3_ANAPL|nr:hypothetical protein Anapl_02121 [Anas platyrhynchos]